MTHPNQLERGNTALVVIDIQEAYRKATFEFDRLAGNVRNLVEGAKILGVPVIVTEQYPKGLGKTVEEIAAVLPEDAPVIEKVTFSCFATEEFVRALEGKKAKHVILTGIESHVCVAQTALDLIDRGYTVHAVREAISARFESNYKIGWKKMLRSGAVPASVESTLFELMGTAKIPEFRAVQKLIM